MHSSAGGLWPARRNPFLLRNNTGEALTVLQVSPTTLFFVEGCGQLSYAMCWGDGFVTDPGEPLWRHAFEGTHSQSSTAE